MATKFIFSKRGSNVDLAALSLAAVAVVLLVALIVQFFLWLKVRYDHKASVATWEGVLSAATDKAERAESAAAAAKARAEEIHADTVARFATVEGTIASVRLKHEALDESVAHLNAKTAAREREQAKAAKRDNKPARGSSDAGDDSTGSENPLQGDILAALAEQSRQHASSTQANGRPVGFNSNGSGRLIPKR